MVYDVFFIHGFSWVECLKLMHAPKHVHLPRGPGGYIWAQTRALPSGRLCQTNRERKTIVPLKWFEDLNRFRLSLHLSAHPLTHLYYSPQIICQLAHAAKLVKDSLSSPYCSNNVTWCFFRIRHYYSNATEHFVPVCRRFLLSTALSLESLPEN